MSFKQWYFWSGLAMLACNTATAQSFPSKPLRIVASEAGGGGDFSARVIAQGMASTMGQPVIVENKAGGVVAGEFVSKSAPDGYTLLNYGNTFWLLPLMRRSVPYDPFKDFTPVAMTIRAITVLVVHPSVPAKSIRELIAVARARPGDLNYGSGAAGASNHLAAELFKSMTGTDIVRIPFKGIGSAINALLTGELQVLFPLMASGMPHVKAGRLRALAITSAQPSELAPGLPTVAASGLPGYVAEGMYGIFAPVKTPAALIVRLNQEIVAVLNKPESKDRFSKSGAEVVGSSSEDMAAAMKAEIASMGKVIRDANIRDD